MARGMPAFGWSAHRMCIAWRPTNPQTTARCAKAQTTRAGSACTCDTYEACPDDRTRLNRNRAIDGLGRERAFPPMTPAEISNPLTARSNGLDDIDGGPDA